MQILVTGGAGYIGSACVKKLREAGHDVVVVDNLSKGRRELLDSDIKFYQLDLAKDNLDSIFNENKIDKIIHFAAYKDAGESMMDLAKYSDNITGTVRLMNAACKQDIKQVIYSSSALCYGEIQYTPIDETHPTIPVNFYGFTKLKCEEIINWYANKHNFNFVALRYFNPIGDAGLNYIDPDARNLCPILMEVATGKREKVLVFGNDYETKDGTCVRDYVDLNDLIDAHLQALELSKSDTINLGTSVGVSVLDMIRYTEEVLGKKIKYEITERRPGDPPVLVAAFAKAEKLLGWKPVTPIKDSILSTWKVYNSKLQ